MPVLESEETDSVFIYVSMKPRLRGYAVEERVWEKGI